MASYLNPGQARTELTATDFAAIDQVLQASAGRPGPAFVAVNQATTVSVPVSTSTVAPTLLTVEFHSVPAFDRPATGAGNGHAGAASSSPAVAKVRPADRPPTNGSSIDSETVDDLFGTLDDSTAQELSARHAAAAKHGTLVVKPAPADTAKPSGLIFKTRMNWAVSMLKPRKPTDNQS